MKVINKVMAGLAAITMLVTSSVMAMTVKYTPMDVPNINSSPEVNNTNQYGLRNKDIVECLVYTPMLNKEVKMWGTANVYMPLNGSITKIERIDFISE